MDSVKVYVLLTQLHTPTNTRVNNPQRYFFITHDRFSFIAIDRQLCGGFIDRTAVDGGPFVTKVWFDDILCGQA